MKLFFFGTLFQGKETIIIIMNFTLIGVHNELFKHCTSINFHNLGNFKAITTFKPGVKYIYRIYLHVKRFSDPQFCSANIVIIYSSKPHRFSKEWFAYCFIKCLIKIFHHLWYFYMQLFQIFGFSSYQIIILAHYEVTVHSFYRRT